MTSKISWKVNYTDENCLRQYNADGSSNKYTDIDRSKLGSVDLVKRGKVFFRMNLGGWQRLILRKRVLKTIGMSSSKVKSVENIWLIGWQATVGGENIQHIHVIYEDGRIETIPEWNKEIYPVNLMEVEKE